jgi:NAD(P)-dependent dehydrogenase (short-subunit alcohol dehydrogenase family)
MDSPVAIITGAGGGIGRACAVDLASRGYRLALCGRTLSTLDVTAKTARAEFVSVTDVASSESVDRMVASVLSHFGRIDLLVNNAGIAPVLDIEQSTDADWHSVMDTNLSAVFYLCRAVWPIFRKQSGGVIVNVSSLAARDPFPGFFAYGAAKAGLNLLGLSLARQGASIGVRVCTVAPGAVETPLFRSLMTPEQFPTENTLSPEDVARVIGQCATGDLRFTSGEVIWMHK